MDTRLVQLICRSICWFWVAVVTWGGQQTEVLDDAIRRRSGVALFSVDVQIRRHPGCWWRASVPTGLAEAIGSGVDEPTLGRP